MKTDVITLCGDLSGRDAAMEAAEKFAAYHEITGKSAMHLRLLTEETISMIHGIFDSFSGSFWLESEKTPDGILCRICLSAKKLANMEQEAQILSVASTGKNESAKGILGKIREMLRRSLQMPSEADAHYLQQMCDTVNDVGNYGFRSPDSNYWSLQIYRQKLSEQKEAQHEEWDELEKSIIAKLSDEVKVWLENDSTTVVIEKLIHHTNK